MTVLYLIKFIAFLALCMFLIGCAQELADTPIVEMEEANDHAAVVKASRAMVPLPPWPAGDQRGMATHWPPAHGCVALITLTNPMPGSTNCHIFAPVKCPHPLGQPPFNMNTPQLWVYPA